MPSTPATRASIPPLHAINARHCGRQFSSHAINARHRGRLFHHCMPSTPAAAGVNPPRMPSTPATAGVYSPIACHQRPPPRASIPPLHAINARHRGRLFPLAKSITSAVGRCLFPLAIYGEGGADRPGVRSKTQTKPPQKPKKPATRAGFEIQLSRFNGILSVARIKR